MFKNQRRKRPNRGFTIIELMVGITLGLTLTALVTTIYISNKQSTLTQRDLAALSQKGAYAINIASRLLQQAGHVAIDGTVIDATKIAPKFCGNVKAQPGPSTGAPVANGGAIEGWDSQATDIGGSIVANSDQILIRFDGASAQNPGGEPDGSVLDCFGKPVAGPSSSVANNVHSLLKLFIARDAKTGNPALYCSYASGKDGAFVTNPIVDGVESMQFLYGVGAVYSTKTDAKIPPNSSPEAYRISVEKYLPASQMSVDDWNNVASVRIGMIVSGDISGSRGDSDSKVYNLFGSPDYSKSDGASFNSASLEKNRRRLLRQVFAATVETKNSPINHVQCHDAPI